MQPLPPAGHWVGVQLDVGNSSVYDFPHQTDPVDLIEARVSVVLAKMLRGYLVRKEIESVDVNDLAERLSGTRLHEFFAVRVDGHLDRARDLIDALRAQHLVRRAWLRGRLRLAGSVVIKPGSKADTEQTHLRDAPAGLGARWALSQELANGRYADGASTTMADVEAGWFQHDDFAQALPLPVVPPQAEMSLVDSDRVHGEAALGLVIANSQDGAMGLAPRSTVVSLGSCFDQQTGEMLFLAEALAAVAVAGPDVVLIEMDRTVDGERVPVEVDPADRQAIQELIALGIHVIEPAGNGATNLAWVQDGDGHHSLSRHGGEAVDSGAIVVSRVNEKTGHLVGNHGARVDCHAWGGAVLTTGTQSDPVHGYSNFTGTSAASAQIAGVALNLLGAAKSQGLTLTPRQLRAALRDVRKGTRAPNLDFPVGPMPDLRRLLRDIEGHDLVGGPVLEHDNQPRPRLGVSPALKIENGSVLVRVKSPRWAAPARAVKVVVAFFEPTTLVDPAKDLMDLMTMDSQVNDNVTDAVSTGPASPTASRTGLVARTLVADDWDQPFSDWTATELMPAARTDPRLALRNVHPLQLGKNHDFRVGGSDEAQLFVLTDTTNSQLSQGNSILPLVNGQTIRVQSGAAVLNAGTTGSFVRLVHLLQGREVGALQFSL